MFGYVLCIDDEPIRYRALRQKLHGMDIFVTTTCNPKDIEEVLNGPARCVGICLDHDMPGMNGVEMARMFLIERNIPVAITSSNEDGSKDISNLLTDFAVPNVRCPCTHKSWEQVAMNLFSDHW